MSSLFLFGAGASYGSGPCYPCNPPLGSNLFAALQAHGGVASTVSPDLAALFAQDFEKGMDDFWIRRNTDTTRFLREMAKFFARFEPMPDNEYINLIRVLGGNRKKVVLVTTNYDLLIEHAVTRSGLLIQYAGLPAAKDNIPILKIHGSCHFLPDLMPSQFSGLSFDLGGSKVASIMNAPVRIATSTKEILDFCEREDSIAPALAMYSPAKQVLFCREFVEAQLQAWKTALSYVSRIYVIGLRVHTVDDHIWGELAKAKAPIYYVGREPEQFLEWARSVGHRSNFVLTDSFKAAIPMIAQHHGTKLN